MTISHRSQLTRYDRPGYSYIRWPGVNCGTRQQSIRGLRDPLTNGRASYVTVECGLIIEDVRPIVKRCIFSHDIIGTDPLFLLQTVRAIRNIKRRPISRRSQQKKAGASNINHIPITATGTTLLNDSRVILIYYDLYTITSRSDNRSDEIRFW